MQYSDSFPQANENPLSSSGVWTGGYTSYSTLQVVSNRVRCSSTSDHRITVSSFTPSSDQFAQFKIVTWNAAAASNIVAHLLLRYTAPATATGYEVIMLRLVGGAESIHMFKTTAGSATELGAGTAVTIAANDIFMFTVSGLDLKFYQNSILRYSASDSTFSSGRIGMGANVDPGGALGDLEIDDFIGGDLYAARNTTYRPRPFAPGIAR